MFIGLIKETGIIEQIKPELIIKISSDFASEIKVESHLSVDGRVLRVLSQEDKDRFSCLKFYPSNLNQFQNYSLQKQVNLEPAVRLGDEIPGTFFYGIPTGFVKFISMERLSEERFLMKVSFENDLIEYLSVMDSVSLNGALLQVIDIKDDLLSFNIYSTTFKTTTFKKNKPGDLLNIELDPITAKIARIFKKLKH